MIVFKEDRKTIQLLHDMRQYTVLEWGTRGRGRHAKYLPLCWLVPAADIPKKHKVMSEEEALRIRQKRHAAGNKAAKTYAVRVADINATLGLPPNARTGKWLSEGLIDRRQAQRIARKVAARHEETDYDMLLNAGVDRDTARDLIAEEQ